MSEVSKIINQQERFFSQKRGGLKDIEDPRDYQAKEILVGVKIDRPSFEQGYRVRDKYWPGMPYKDQKTTWSCTGQAWAYYKQILQAKDTGEKTELSAFSLYNPVAFPGVGAYIRDPGLRTVNYGVNKEATLPSPGNENAMTIQFNFEPYKDEASYYKNRVVASVDTQSFDKLADMIFLNDGIVSGWNAHCVYFDEYGVLNGVRFLKTMNSYGPGNDLYYFEGTGQGWLYSAWTAIDVKNMSTKGKVKLVRAEGEENVWFILGGRRYLVYNPTMMGDGLAEGIWEGFVGVEVLTKQEVYSVPKGNATLGDLWKFYTSK